MFIGQVMMKICMFGSSFLPKIGGMELAMHYLASSFVKLGNDVTLLVENMKDNHVHLSINYTIVRYGFKFPFSGRSGADYLFALIMFMRECKRKKFDVVHCHDVFFSGSIARLTEKKYGFSLVMTPHGEAVRMVPEIQYGMRLDKKLNKKITKNLLSAGSVTALCKSFTKDLDFIPKDKIVEIPNGIDISLFNSQKSKYLHSAINIDEKTKILISIGRNHTVKGYSFGIQAFKILLKSNIDDIVYVIIGKDTDALYPLVHSLGLENKVFLLPQTDPSTILKYYQSAWSFFSPSLSEGLSLVSLEAMAAGLPLIVTNVPGNMDIVTENKCGIIVKSKDTLSMANGILRLYDNKLLYDNCSVESLESSKKYDWMCVAKKYLEVFEKLDNKKKCEN